MTQTTTFDRLIGILRPLALIALIAWASSGHIARAADRDPAMPSVVGEVVPRQGGEIAAAIAAPVERVSVVAGDRVQAGQDLAQLNIDDRRADFETSRTQINVAKAELDVRKAALELERANLDRQASLRGSAAFNASRLVDSQKAIAQLRAEIAVSEARIEEARARAKRLLVDIERARVVAPYNAVVTAREVDEGDFVTPGRRMFRLVNIEALEIEADVPVAALSRLIEGARIEAETREGMPVAVTVRALIPVENPLTRTRTVRFTVEGSPALAVGQPVELYLPEYEGG